MSIAASKLLSPEEEGGWIADGKAHTVSLFDVRADIIIRRSIDLLNVNYAPATVLVEGLARQGIQRDISMQLADQIVDWRDADSIEMPLGAEADAYVALGRAGLPPNSPFIAISELRTLPSMTSDVFTKLAPLVTILGTHKGYSGAMLSRSATADQRVTQSGTFPDLRNSKREETTREADRMKVAYDGITRQVGDSQPGFFVVSIYFEAGETRRVYQGAFQFISKAGASDMRELQFMERMPE